MIYGNVGRTISKTIPQMGGLWHCFIHINRYWLSIIVIYLIYNGSISIESYKGNLINSFSIHQASNNPSCSL